MLVTVLGATAIGITLGLLGSGGSILTIPILVYLLGHDGKVAIAESLAIVGGIASVGVIPFARVRLIAWRKVLSFGLPGVVGTYLGAQRAATLSGTTQLLIFGSVMLVAAGMMFFGSRRPKSPVPSEATEAPRLEPRSRSVWTTFLEPIEGLGVGVITGIVGVGGGFLIVPALVLLGGLDMRKAVGTSLVIIVINSVAGFAKHYQTIQQSESSIDPLTIATFIGIGVIGMWIGKSLNNRLDPSLLRKGFAFFLVAMGVLVLVRETVFG
ncbi:MAG: sulfite exporter TauE/SafE family protein [Planctomycetales bacterium]|nr:sulfite exporter TauE/SafE family protein [Planctomycetales bacterium]